MLYTQNFMHLNKSFHHPFGKITKTVFGWLVIVAGADFFVREILLTGCSEDEANRVKIKTKQITITLKFRVRTTKTNVPF